MNYCKRDSASVWHPYTQHYLSRENLIVKAAKGNYIYLEDGRKVLDAISSWWVNLHGHSHPFMLEKIKETMDQLQQVIFAGFSHPTAITLAEKILGLFNNQFSKAFFSDNGSTSVEVALKMCFQYWANQNVNRKKMIAFRGAYHGDTFGAMSVAERSAFTRPFWPFLFEVEFIDPPLGNGKSLQQVEEILSRHSEDVAGIIFEPMVQGSAGMLMQDPKELDEVIQKIRNVGGLVIADEVMTGFGRTGQTFAINHLKSKVDIVCLSKGLTGGMLPLGLTLASQEIYNSFLSSDRSKTLFHRHSFTGNAISCAAALASLELLESSDCKKRIQKIIEYQEAIKRFIGSQTYPIRAIRSQGTILAIELEVGGRSGYFNERRDFIYQYFLSKGVLLRPLGNVIYVLPPYSFEGPELDFTYSCIFDFLRTQR